MLILMIIEGARHPSIRLRRDDGFHAGARDGRDQGLASKDWLAMLASVVRP